jgi:Patatin-like phospholipase
MRRGLVLEGGGAKGAYKLGCLRAFREQAISFDAIAGTSIGALNGALLASDKVDLGTTYWENVSLRGALRPRWRLVPVTPLVVLYVASYFYNRGGYSRPPGLRNAKIVLIWFLAMCVITAIFAGLMEAWWYALFMTLLFGVPWAAFYGLRAARFAVFSQTPLRAFLEQVVNDSSALSIPIYVTVANHESGFDPDTPRLFYGKDLRDDVVWGAVDDEYEYPNYIKINDLPGGEQGNYSRAAPRCRWAYFLPSELIRATISTEGLQTTSPCIPLRPSRSVLK